MVLAVAALATVGLMPAAHAAPRLSVEVWGSVTAEYVKRCAHTAPYACGTFTNVASFTISTWGQRSPVTVSYRFESGSATAGVDFTGPFTGSVTIQPNFPQAWVSVPVVNDGIPEPTENLFLRITGVSAPANIGPPDETLIFDGGNVPVDCDMWRDADSGSITCTNRPAGQQWRTNVTCDRGDDWPNEWTRMYTRYGSTVTGNGTSGADCDAGDTTLGPAFQPL
jgi:hypothetical protein